MEFGLIGEKLGHSFSGEIHEKIGRYPYEIVPLAPQALEDFMMTRQFKGINVTIPYKQAVMEYCHEIDPHAKEIGAVNTIINRKGLLYGYNTDYYGFSYLVQRHGVDLQNKSVLILGDGGTTRTVSAVAKAQGARSVQVASRTPKPHTISYEQAALDSGVEIIINASPAGMYPNNGTILVNLDDFPRLEAVFDAVYNPLVSELLYGAKERGVTAVGGLEMLVAQAKAAGEYFLDEKLSDDIIKTIFKDLRQQMSNVSLIGMPGSGKSTLGRELAVRTGKKFVDIDAEIERKAGKPIPQMFEKEGEEIFRQMEQEITAQYSKETGQVLSTGGGVILRKDNVKHLKQNGMIIWIDAAVEQLSLGRNRPLAKELEDLERLSKQRHELYEQAADYRHEFLSDYSENINGLMRLYERVK